MLRTPTVSPIMSNKHTAPPVPQGLRAPRGAYQPCPAESRFPQPTPIILHPPQSDTLPSPRLVLASPESETPPAATTKTQEYTSASPAHRLKPRKLDRTQQACWRRPTIQTPTPDGTQRWRHAQDSSPVSSNGRPCFSVHSPLRASNGTCPSLTTDPPTETKGFPSCRSHRM